MSDGGDDARGVGHIGSLQIWLEGSVPAPGDWLRGSADATRLFGYGAAASVRSWACGGGKRDVAAETRNKMRASQTETRRLGQRICRWHPDLRIIRGGARRDLAGGGPDARGRNRLDAGDHPFPYAPARPSTPSPPSLLLPSSLTTLAHSAYPVGLTRWAGIYYRQLQRRQQRERSRAKWRRRNAAARRRRSSCQHSPAGSRHRPGSFGNGDPGVPAATVGLPSLELRLRQPPPRRQRGADQAKFPPDHLTVKSKAGASHENTDRAPLVPITTS